MRYSRLYALLGDGVPLCNCPQGLMAPDVVLMHVRSFLKNP